MIIAALNEHPETRVAITPLTTKNYIKLGLDVGIESQAGFASGFDDRDYEEQGARIFKDRKTLLNQTGILLSVREPCSDSLSQLSAHTLLAAPIDKNPENTLVKLANENQISLFSMQLIPRITRAQNMDILSSQSNLAGYRAVLEGVCHFKRAIPMMMTAAGMIKPAKILILGAGVAGLQAIATAKRLGAVVYAFDVRRAAKEQVESLGAEFIEVSQEDSETESGYAGETSDEYKRLQTKLLFEYTHLADIIVTTALIPGRPAPKLLDKKMVDHMRSGSVIVDLAASHGGNCELTVKDSIVDHKGIIIIGYDNLPGLIPATASELYSNNCFNLIKSLMITPPDLLFNPDDEILQQAMLCHNGQYLPFQPKKDANS